MDLFVQDLPAKTPAESVVIPFDFTGEMDVILDATITVEPINSADPSSALMVAGTRQIQGTQVLQRIAYGLARTDYLITCTAVNGAEVRQMFARLPVRLP